MRKNARNGHGLAPLLRKRASARARLDWRADYRQEPGLRGRIKSSEATDQRESALAIAGAVLRADLTILASKPISQTKRWAGRQKLFDLGYDVEQTIQIKRLALHLEERAL